MKSLLKFLMIILIAGPIKASEDIVKKIETRSDKANKEADFFTYQFDMNNAKTTVVSYFDMQKYEPGFRGALYLALSEPHDLRRLEKIYCQAAYATMPLCKQNRGKLGFMLGAVSALIPWAIFQYHNNRKNVESEQTT